MALVKFYIFIRKFGRICQATQYLVFKISNVLIKQNMFCGSKRENIIVMKRAIYWFIFQTKIPLTLLAELVKTGPIGVQICSSGSFDLDEQKSSKKMSPLLKSGINDPGLCICEYRLWLYLS